MGTLLYTACALAAAAPAGASDGPQARYEQERAACLAGTSNQDRDTCLREAGAALAQTRREGAASAPETPYAENALRRCERLPEGDRKDCVARMHGEGQRSGSVESGGIYRELVTPDKPAP